MFFIKNMFIKYIALVVVVNLFSCSLFFPDNIEDSTIGLEISFSESAISNSMFTTTFQFLNKVTAFESRDIISTGGTFNNFRETTSNKTYVIDVIRNPPNIAVTITVKAGSFLNRLGISNSQSYNNTIAFLGTNPNMVNNFAFSSSAFINGGAIAESYQYSPPAAMASTTISNRSPAFFWTNPPNGTESFVIIIHDINGNNWVHWIAYDIPNSVTNLAENIGKSLTQVIGSTNMKQGYNSYTGETSNPDYVGYDGPIRVDFAIRPPGVHNYVFTLYALNTNSYTPPTPSTTLNAATAAYYTAVTNALAGKIIKSTNFTGTTSP